MTTVRLTRAEAELIESDPKMPADVRAKIRRLLLRTEKGIIIAVGEKTKAQIEQALNPHLKGM